MGLRKACYKGPLRTRFQHMATAVAINHSVPSFYWLTGDRPMETLIPACVAMAST